jgi:hypothetical protein
MDSIRPFRRCAKQKSLEIPQVPAGADGLRLMIAESQGNSYKFFRNLSDAVAHDAIVILQGDEAGQIYLTCPATKVKCTETDLQRLLEYLDSKAWKDLDSAGIFYESPSPEGTVSGGMGGGLVVNGVWLHPRLVDMGIEDKVKAFITGESASL